MLVIRCIHCANYNSKYCAKCLGSKLPYTAYRERAITVPPDISYEDLEKLDKTK